MDYYFKKLIIFAAMGLGLFLSANSAQAGGTINVNSNLSVCWWVSGPVSGGECSTGGSFGGLPSGWYSISAPTPSGYHIASCCGSPNPDFLGDGGSINWSVVYEQDAPPPPPPPAPPAPSCSASFSPTSGNRGAGYTFSWNTNDEDGSIPYSCSGSWGSGTLSGATSSTTGTIDGTQTCTLTVTTGGGTTQCSATITENAPPPPPAPSCSASFSPTSGNNGTPYTFSWNSNDADGVIPFSCSGSWGSSSLSGANSFITGIIDGTQTCTLTVANSAGTSTTCSATITGVQPLGSVAITSNNQSAAHYITYPDGSIHGWVGDHTWTSLQPGVYSLAPDNVSGYTMSLSPGSPQTLSSGGTINWSINYTAIPVVSATITSSGLSSVTIPYNSSVDVNWSSSNASSCTVSPTGWSGTSGTQSTGNLTSSQVYTITCNR